MLQSNAVPSSSSFGKAPVTSKLSFVCTSGVKDTVGDLLDMRIPTTNIPWIIDYGEDGDDTGKGNKDKKRKPRVNEIPYQFPSYGSIH